MIVTFIEVFTEYLSVMAFMYKAANQKYRWNKTFFAIAIMEFGIVMSSGKYIDNRLGMIMIYSLLFLYAKIKITHDWKPTARVFGTMLIGIPVLQIVVYYLLKDFMIELKDYRWYGIFVNCIICALILLWKEKYIYKIGTKITRFKEVFLVILFVLFFFELLLLYKKDGYITTQVQIQALVSVGGLVLVMVLWMSSEMEKEEKQEELKMYELYTKTFEDLITAIRIKQHEFHNHINAIKCLPYTAQNAEELIAEQNRYCDVVLEDTQIVKLLKLESSPVLCGFLYSKKKLLYFFVGINSANICNFQQKLCIFIRRQSQDNLIAISILSFFFYQCFHCIVKQNACNFNKMMNYAIALYRNRIDFVFHIDIQRLGKNKFGIQKST